MREEQRHRRSPPSGSSETFQDLRSAAFILASRTAREAALSWVIRLPLCLGGNKGERPMDETETWKSDSDWIRSEMGCEITKRRIRKVSFKHNGKVMLAEVGQCNPYNGLPLRAIYEHASLGVYLLCGGTITIAPKDSLVEEY